MSFDIMVFDPENAPQEIDSFLDWYQNQAEWREEHDYDDPSVCNSDNLRNFFMELKETYPPMNGEYSPTDEELDEGIVNEDDMADYSIGSEVIYVAFSYSQADDAYDRMKELSEEYELGFFNPQKDELIFF